MAQYNRHMYPTIIWQHCNVIVPYIVDQVRLTDSEHSVRHMYRPCNLDCLLTFDLLNPNSKQFAYIHLRAISCNETLSTSIGNIFSNRNNIQPTFTPRQLAEKILAYFFSFLLPISVSVYLCHLLLIPIFQLQLSCCLLFTDSSTGPYN